MRIKPSQSVLPLPSAGLADTPAEAAFFDRPQVPSHGLPTPRAPAVASRSSAFSVQLYALAPLRGYDARFRSILDDATGTRVSKGNDVRPLFDGSQAFAERFAMIDRAQHSILLQTFIFTSDDTGWAMAEKLAAKARQGVKVCVIYDAVGTGRSDPKMFEMMREAGVEVRDLGHVEGLNKRWHEKLFIVDGEEAVTGGMNIANEYAYGGTGKVVHTRDNSPAWRDCDVHVRGPVVRGMALDFLANWEALGPGWSEAEEAALVARAPQAIAGGVETRFFTRKANGQEMDAYYYAIAAAQESITIENAYFAPPSDIRQALVDAAKRGVKVRVFTNGYATNDITFVTHVMRYYYDELVAAGVEIYEKQGGTLHSKTATFDGQFSFIGSMNLNSRSDLHDTESVLAIHDGATAHALEQRFDSGMSEARRVTLDELRNEGPLLNAQQWGAKVLLGSFT